MAVTNPQRRSGRLSDISCRYAAALYDPKNCQEAPNIPTSTQLSQKVKTFTRGSFASGTTGYGYIVVQPSEMISNSVPAATASTSTTVATAATLGGSYTNLASSSNSNSPWASTSYGTSAAQLQWRLIGCALYLKYAGTELNRGGDIILVQEPGHRSLNLYSYNTAMTFDHAKRVPMGNDWVHVCYTPGTYAGPIGNVTDDTDFSSTSPDSVGTLYLGAFVNTAGASQPLDYELYCWFEVVGSLARGATISYSDPIGFAAIDGAADEYGQLDSVLGMDRFVHSIENQLDNMSGVAQNASHVQNWAGLAAFLPQLAEVAKRALGGAAKGALKEFGYVNKEKKKQKSAPPLPPPPRPHAAPSKALTNAALKAAAMKLKTRK